MLIENEYRGSKYALTLAYNDSPDDKPCVVPKNLYIIGLMNTADRSLAIIDYALRRRFSFVEMNPQFDSKAFKEYQSGIGNEVFDKLIATILEMNKEISKDDSLGPWFQIGHSYFCGMDKESCTNDRLCEIVEYDIIPMIQEYWFDNKDKVEKWSKALIAVFND